MFNSDVMEEVENYALQFLKKGRKNWDEPHTRAVVFYATKIGKANNLDLLVMATAAWFHDIGYFGLFKGNESDDYKNILDRKSQHMISGAKMAGEFLERSDIESKYTKKQKERIIHLVSVHDKLDELRDLDEIVLMEADSLGAIDIEKVTPSFSKEGMLKFLAGSRKGRFSRFRTKEGKQYYEKLIVAYKAFADSRK